MSTKDLILLQSPFDAHDASQPLGNPHHGIVDGTALADGGAGVTHPGLVPYVQNPRYWITPCLDLVVPGHSFTAPALPPAGVTWLDHAIISGANRTLYQTETGVLADHARRWLVSFGPGDTWAVNISQSIAADASGGYAQVDVDLVPFGRFNEDPPAATIGLSSNALTPCGQPSFSGTSSDFPATPLMLQAFDISQDGQRVIFGVVDATDITTYHGYGAPRGFLLLELTKTSATLSLLKSRSEMLVSGTQTLSESHSGGTADADFSCTVDAPFYVTVPAYTASGSDVVSSSNLVAAWFDAAGAIQYLRYDVSATKTRSINATAYDVYVHGCSGGTADYTEVAPGQSATYTDSATYSGSVSLVRVSDSVVMKSASWSGSGTMSQTAAEAGGFFDVTAGSSYTHNGTGFGGGTWSAPLTTSATASGQSWASPWLLGVWEPGWGVFAVYQTGVSGAFTRAPTGFDEIPTYGYPVCQVGLLGMIAHEIPYYGGVETFVGLLRRTSYAALPHDDTQGMVVCAHPRTGQIIYKQVAYGLTPPPSYGFA